MRLWNIQELFNDIHDKMPKARKHVRLVHVCTNCGWRTPELAPLDCMAREISMHPPREYEIKNNGFCDKCNQKCWQEIKDYCEHQKNNCEWCGGGRCRHYPEDKK